MDWVSEVGSRSSFEIRGESGLRMGVMFQDGSMSRVSEVDLGSGSGMRIRVVFCVFGSGLGLGFRIRVRLQKTISTPVSETQHRSYSQNQTRPPS